MSSHACHPKLPHDLSSVSSTGICNRPQPCLSSSSQEPDVPVLPCGTTDLGASPGLATWPLSPQRKELLDHLHHSLLPWDESILDKMPPRLILGAYSSGAGLERMFSVTEGRKGLLSCVLGRKVMRPSHGGRNGWSSTSGQSLPRPRGLGQPPFPWERGQKKMNSS